MNQRGAASNFSIVWAETQPPLRPGAGCGRRGQLTHDIARRPAAPNPPLTIRRCNKGLAEAKPLFCLVPAAGLEPAT